MSENSATEHGVTERKAEGKEEHDAFENAALSSVALSIERTSGETCQERRGERTEEPFV